MGTLTSQEITFYVPARNAADTLEACLASVAAQTLPPGEILVIADARSADATVSVARGVPGVRVVEQTSGGLGRARNLAIEEARTDWLASCDADVTLDENWLEHLAGHAHRGTVGIGGRVEERVRSPYDQWRAINLPHHWGDAPFRNPYMLVSDVLFDRRALMAVGGYRNELSYHEDALLCGALRDAGFDLQYEPAALALHHRVDSLQSVLTLRWNYARYRQRHAFESFTGLGRKAAVNREYGLLTLGKVLATGQEALSYISFLLFYHHAVHDLHELLRLRPLVSPAERRVCEQQLVGGMMASLGQVDDRLANLVAEDLIGLPPEPEAGGHLLYAPPAWSDYLRTMERAAADFADELSPDLRALVEHAGAFLHDRAPRDRVPAVSQPAPGHIRQALERVPVGPVLDDAACEHWRGLLGSADDVILLGAADPADRDRLGRHFRVQSVSWSDFDAEIPLRPGPVIVLHLETDPQPLRRLESLANRSEHLIVIYAPPKVFVPALEPLWARDLASAAGRAGFEIRRFDTLVGTTTLVLRRQSTTLPPTNVPEPALAASCPT